MATNMLRKTSRFFSAMKSDSAPSDSAPSDNAPSDVQATPANQKKFLAFRTITKLLSLTQQQQAFEVLSEKPTAAEQEELALSTAFATIAVLDHEVVAVVTQSKTIFENKNDQKLDLLCTTEGDSTKGSSNTGYGGLLKFFLTRNPRDQDTIMVPTIIHATDTQVPGCNLIDDEGLNRWVEQRWCAPRKYIIGVCAYQCPPSVQ
jgi:hypothetical protein